MRSSAVMNFENDDKYCFVWSILSKLHPCENDHPNNFSNYRQFFTELVNQGFDITNGLKCSDVHSFN